MTSRAELSSIASTLTELTRRLANLAESARDGGDEDLAHDLFSVERSLAGALRRLAKTAEGR